MSASARRAAEAICERRDASASDLGAVPDNAAMAKALRMVVAAHRETLTELQEVADDAPDDEAYAAWLAEFDAVLDYYDRATAIDPTVEADDFAATLEGAFNAQQTFDRQSEALGFDHCRFRTDAAAAPSSSSVPSPSSVP